MISEDERNGNTSIDSLRTQDTKHFWKHELLDMFYHYVSIVLFPILTCFTGWSKNWMKTTSMHFWWTLVCPMRIRRFLLANPDASRCNQDAAWALTMYSNKPVSQHGYSWGAMSTHVASCIRMMQWEYVAEHIVNTCGALWLCMVKANFGHERRAMNMERISTKQIEITFRRSPLENMILRTSDWDVSRLLYLFYDLK